MKKEKIDSYTIEKLNLNSSAILKHFECTEWKERIIIAYAKALSLVSLVLIGTATLFVCAFRTDDYNTFIHTLSPIVTGVLAFFAGRSSR